MCFSIFSALGRQHENITGPFLCGGSSGMLLSSGRKGRAAVQDSDQKLLQIEGIPSNIYVSDLQWPLQHGFIHSIFLSSVLLLRKIQQAAFHGLLTRQCDFQNFKYTLLANLERKQIAM